MATATKSLLPLLSVLMFVPQAAALGQSTPLDGIVNQVEEKVEGYVTSLADLHCTESVTQEKLGPKGHVQAKEHAQYDYLIMMQGGVDDFQLNETRIAASSGKSKPIPTSMLVSNGIATALLVFHPYYRDSFKFEIGQDETVDGKSLVPIHFEQIPGRRTPAALALRGREYPLELKGTAWIDRQSDEVVKLEASLVNDMSDIGLHALQIHVEYRPVPIGKAESTFDLPMVAVVDVTTARQHWRNTHVFDAYKSFSTDVEQDPNVKVHVANTVGGTNGVAANTPEDTKERR